MDFEQLSKDFHSIWQHQPLAVVLLFAGFIIFLFLVVDAWVHKQRRRKGSRLH